MAVRRARFIASRRSGRDPVTGFRGLGAGAQAAAALGSAFIACELTWESSGPCLRGQLSGGTEEDFVGAMVHVRTRDGLALACVGPSGEFAARSLPSERIDRIDIELDAALWSLTRPFGDVE
jgi:hypothetical protein